MQQISMLLIDQPELFWNLPVDVCLQDVFSSPYVRKCKYVMFNDDGDKHWYKCFLPGYTSIGRENPKFILGSGYNTEKWQYLSYGLERKKKKSYQFLELKGFAHYIAELYAQVRINFQNLYQRSYQIKDNDNQSPQFWRVPKLEEP